MTTDKIIINVVSVAIATMASRTIFLRGYLYGRSERVGDLDEKLKKSIIIKSIINYIMIIISIAIVQY